MLRYGFVPYRREGNALVIVVSDPTDLPMIDELAVLLATPIRVTVGTPSAIQAILKKSESSQRVLEEATESFQLQILREDEQGDEQLTVDKLTADQSPVIRLVDTTLYSAIQRRASDIHIETQDDAVHVKYRIDGVLQAAMRPIDKRFHSTIISRIKVMAELDIAEKRDSAGRPLQAADGRQDHRLPRLDHAERPRRGRGHPYSRQGVDQRAVPRAAARHPRVSRGRAAALPQVHRRALRHGAGHRARPAAARRRRSTRRCRRSSRSKTRSSRSRIRSNTSCAASRRSRSTRKRG